MGVKSLTFSYSIYALSMLYLYTIHEVPKKHQFDGRIQYGGINDLFGSFVYLYTSKSLNFKRNILKKTPHSGLSWGKRNSPPHKFDSIDY